MTKIYRTKKINFLMFIILGIIYLGIISIIISTFPPNNFYEIIITVFLYLIGAICFILSMHYCQYVIFSENGIEFKSVLKKQNTIRWDEITDISIIDKKTYSNSMGYNVYYNWIKINNICNEQRNKPVVDEIFYTPRNLDILLKYVKKYNQDINIDNIPNNISVKSTKKGYFK